MNSLTSGPSANCSKLLVSDKTNFFDQNTCFLETCPLYSHDIYRQSGQNQANTRSSVSKLKHPLKNMYSGQKNLSYLTPIVWNSLLMDLKLANSLNNFKHKLKGHFCKKLRNMEQNIFAS